ncbi:MAG: insulinase family protein [Flavobacteriaceae bacterium]|jgi:zinc protease|nr:insulinase family protein [Flavobacteriaceae bacterium]MDO7580931.1 insulinase family protein [Flavobacteriaceae bacterium]MDO7591883.1 insulinase family protein [Flavobacteriaceae bacterium]MDO7599359.1 insulinase family protein [Flavobacteriaceae bacterium]MDO7603838.1 insulinase family protein [Flavobacteriaceae bacterium]
MKNIYILYIALFSLSSLAAQIDRSVQPTPGPAPVIQLDEPQSFTLKNGMTVMVVENHKLPRVSVTLNIDNPPIFEGDLAGANSLLGSMLGKGSLSVAKNDFEEEVDFMGASLNFGPSGAFGSSLSRYFPRVLELMADAALNPNFLNEEFEKEKEKLIEGIKSDEKSVPAAAARVENLITYGANHPYGEYTKIETVSKINLDDVKKYYQSNYNPKNAYLVIIGDVDYKAIKKQVSKLFKKWKGNAPSAYVFEPAKNSSELEIHFTEMSNAVQSEVSVGFTNSIKKTHPDYFPMLLGNSILGGGGEARLFLNLREDKGYTYGSYSRMQTNKYTRARIKAFASVRNAVTDSSVVELVKELDKIRIEEVTQAELDKAKAKYVGDFVLALESPRTIAQYALSIRVENLPEDFYKTYLQKINAVTVADVLAATKKHIKLDKARIFVAGKGSEVLENLEKVAPFGKKLKVSYYDQYGTPTERPDYSSQLPEGVTSASILNNYFDALGGLDKLKGISSKSEIAEGSMQGMQLQIKSKKTNQKQSSLEVSMMGNVLQKQVINKDKGYMEAQGQHIDLAGEELENAIMDSQIFPELSIDPSAVKARVADVNGVAAYELAVSESKSFFYDQKTFLKIKISETQEVQGNTITQETLVGDYKAVDGILFPHKLTQSFGPQSIDFITKSIGLNGTIDGADFN